MIGFDQAARLHRLFVDATLDRLGDSGVPFAVALGFDPDGSFAGELRARGHTVIPQADGDLGDRMRAVLRGPGRRVVVGTDCVVFDPDWVVQATLSRAPIAIAPSEDGGYWALSIDGTLPDSVLDLLFRDMPWSTPEVLPLTLDRCAAHGVAVELLPESYDIDDPTDLSRLLHDPRCPPPVRSLLESFPCLS